MKLNKMIPLFLAVIMVFSAIPARVFAEGATPSTPSYLRIIGTVLSDSSDAVQIQLDASEDVCGGGFTLVYDTAVLEASYVETPYGASYQVSSNITTGKVQVSFAAAEAIEDGLLVLIHFRIRVDSSTSTQLMLEDMKLYNDQGLPLDTEAKNAVCDVKKVTGPSSIKLPKEQLILGSGDSYDMEPIFTPSDAVVDQETWYSYDESIVKVDENGVLTAYGTGTTTIRYEAYSVLTGYRYAYCDVTVYAKPKVLVSDAQAAVGAVVTIPVRMESSGNSFTAGSMNLEYDPEHLRLISCEAGELLASTIVIINETYEENAARLTFAGQLPLAGAGTLCLLTFEVLREGTSEIQAADVLFYADANDSYHSILESGTVQTGVGTLSVSDYSGSIGVSSIMKLSYDGEMPIAGGSVTLRYDPARLTFGEAASLSGSMSVFTNVDRENGIIKLSFAGTTGQTEVDIVKLSFAAVDDQPVLTEVEILSADLYNEEGSKIAPACKSGRVMMSNAGVAENPGDVNGDDTITEWDAVLLAGMLAGNIPSDVVFEAGDLNGDGWIDDEDMLFLMKQLIAE